MLLKRQETLEASQREGYKIRAIEQIIKDDEKSSKCLFSKETEMARKKQVDVSLNKNSNPWNQKMK